jgi:Cu+-exporting ATPase
VNEATQLADQRPRERTVSIAVGGMTCGACAARVERRLNALEGVRATVNLATERARVQLPADLEVGRLLREVEAAGYSAEALDGPAVTATVDLAASRRVSQLGRRLVVAIVLFMPLCDASIAFWLVPSVRFTGWQWVLSALAAPVLTYCGWPIYAAAVRAARHRTTTMDTLVSIGILAATAWSIHAMFWQDTSNARESVLWVIEHGAGGAIYLDVAAGVTTFLLAGRFFEATFKRRAGEALRSLVDLGAKDAALLDVDGNERLVAIPQLEVGDRFVVRPGETVATDGVVESGTSALDRRAMTGEAEPVGVGPGDEVLGGTTCVDGRVVVCATRVGVDTQLATMIRLVEDAQSAKASVQRLADRISGIFVPSVLVISVATLLGWLAAGGGAERAFEAALCVLIIACPCALGLATPTALVVAAGRGAQLGIFFKGYDALEASRGVDTVLLDKTGTLTHGAFDVTGLRPSAGVDEDSLLRWAGSLERASEHPIGRGISTYAEHRVGELPAVEAFTALPGLGARGLVEGAVTTVGRRHRIARR